MKSQYEKLVLTKEEKTKLFREKNKRRKAAKKRHGAEWRIGNVARSGVGGGFAGVPKDYKRICELGLK